MSWQERLDNIDFEIKTGDGKTFKPLWKSGEKSKEFNITKYDFINLKGSLIERKKPQSNIYPLVFFFQGENNIEQSDDFENSANDNRLWTVEHPFYGTIKGQPVNLSRKDTSYNVTEISVDFWESIDGDFPISSISITDETRAKVESVNELATVHLVENAKPESTDINISKDNVNQTSAKFTPDDNSYTDYVNIVNKALNNADKLVTDTESAFGDILEVLTAPAKFDNSVSSRIDSYKESYRIIKNSIDSLYSKYDFESQGAALLAGICLSAVTPQDGNYITRSDIEIVNKTLIESFDDYLKTLDDSQVEIYDIEDTWTPTIQIQLALADLVFFTSNFLFQLSFNARQERQIELTEDTNLIVLTHKYLGLDNDDANIEIFRRINNIKNDELFKVSKGRTIKYFLKDES